MRAFHFQIALMEEHFNENYVESDIYPKATFRGEFMSFLKTSNRNKVLVNGIIDFHGVKKKCHSCSYGTRGPKINWRM